MSGCLSIDRNEWGTVRMPIEVSREKAVESDERPFARPVGTAAAIFIGLQFLDLATTLAVFSRGGVELNPVIRTLMPWTGRLLAIVLSKATLLSVILLLGRRRRLLRFANVFYTGVVVWNIVMFFALRQTNSL